MRGCLKATLMLFLNSSYEGEAKMVQIWLNDPLAKIKSFESHKKRVKIEYYGKQC